MTDMDFADLIGDQGEAEKAATRKPFNAAKVVEDRKARNARALEQFRQTEPVRGRSEIKVLNGHIRFAPSVNGNPLSFTVKVDGKTVERDHLLIASDKFEAVIAAFNKALDAGDWNARLEEAANAESKAARKPRAAKPDPVTVETPGDKSGDGGAEVKPDASHEADEAPAKRGRKAKAPEPA